MTKQINKRQIVVLAIVLVLFNTACTHVKAYQKNKLNDSEMALSSRNVQRNELNAMTYREGASGANGGKTGGGCGCN